MAQGFMVADHGFTTTRARGERENGRRAPYNNGYICCRAPFCPEPLVEGLRRIDCAYTHLITLYTIRNVLCVQEKRLNIFISVLEYNTVPYQNKDINPLNYYLLQSIVVSTAVYECSVTILFVLGIHRYTKCMQYCKHRGITLLLDSIFQKETYCKSMHVHGKRCCPSLSLVKYGDPACTKIRNYRGWSRISWYCVDCWDFGLKFAQSKSDDIWKFINPVSCT